MIIEKESIHHIWHHSHSTSPCMSSYTSAHIAYQTTRVSKHDRKYWSTDCKFLLVKLATACFSALLFPLMDWQWGTFQLLLCASKMVIDDKWFRWICILCFKRKAPLCYCKCSDKRRQEDKWCQITLNCLNWGHSHSAQYQDKPKKVHYHCLPSALVIKTKRKTRPCREWKMKGPVRLKAL